MGKPARIRSNASAGPGAKEFRALHRSARISPYKARPVIDLIRGKQVEVALELLEYEPRRAASLIRKVVRSALSNASNDLDIDLKALVVLDARVDGAGLLQGRRRYMARAQGRAFPILKRTSHISVTLGPRAGARGEE
jgi:large subunit ribosomal protein L22